MNKKIIFCADGTWNGPTDVNSAPEGKAPDRAAPDCTADLTNVCKLFSWLSGRLTLNGGVWGGPEMEKELLNGAGEAVQVAKYIHGVGDATNWSDRLLGGVFGVGVIARIARGYTYISRNYNPGDSIVITGFSRGAYTARALATLIAGKGLLRPDLAGKSDDDRYDTAAAAWFQWRHDGDNFLQKILDRMSEIAITRQAFPNPKPLTPDCFIPVDIQAVAVWDTVGELGIPVYRGDTTLDVFRFCDHALSEKIGVGIHAVALDEERVPFTPSLWDASPREIQRLFPGGHGDIGGGYADHGLSDGPLNWICDQLKQAPIGLTFGAALVCGQKAVPTAPRHREWVTSPDWQKLGVGRRHIPLGMQRDPSVGAREVAGPELLFKDPNNTLPYAPRNPLL